MTDKLNQNQQPELSERDAELLSAYIDDMLSADERRTLEARLHSEAFLRAELAAMRQTLAWMNALPNLKAPRNFTITAADVAPSKQAPKGKVIPMQNRNWWLAASAAAAMIILVIGFLAVLPALQNAAPAGGDNQAAEVALFATDTSNPTHTAQTFAITVEDADDANSGVALSAPAADGESDGSDDDSSAADMADTGNATGSSGVGNTSGSGETGMDESAEFTTNTTASTANTQLQAPPDTASRSVIGDVQQTATALTYSVALTPTQVPTMTQSMPQGGGAAAQNSPIAPNIAQSVPESTDDIVVDTTILPEIASAPPAASSVATVLGEMEAAFEDIEPETSEDDAVSTGAEDPDEEQSLTLEGENRAEPEEKVANLVASMIHAARAFIESLQP